MFEATKIRAREYLSRINAVGGVLPWLVMAIPLYGIGLNVADGPNSTQVIIESKLDDFLEDEHGCRNVRLNLGEQETSATLAVAWVVENNANVGLELPSCTSACGCIRGIPAGITLAIGERTKVEFQLQVPKEEGRIVRPIAFFDRGGTCRLRLEIELDPVSPFVIPDVIAINREGKQRIVVPLEFEAEGRKLEEFGLDVAGAGVLSSQMIAAESRNHARVELEVDTEYMGDNSLVQVEFDFISLERGVQHTKLLRNLWIKNRPFTKPKVVTLIRDGDEWIGDFDLYANADGVTPREASTNDIVVRDAQGTILPVRSQCKINVAESKDWTLGVDCRIAIEDPGKLLNRGNAFTASFTIPGTVVYVKLFATR